MPTIFINTSVSPANLNNEKLTQSLDQDFRNDLNELVTKLISKTNMMNSFSIKYDMDDLTPISSNQPTINNKCICQKMAKIFKSLLNENCTENEPELNSTTTNKSKEKDVNNLFKEMEQIKTSQVAMANKLDLILNKLNNPANSDQEPNPNVQLTGAKKRKFQSNNYNMLNSLNAISNGSNFINDENDSHSSNHDGDVLNTRNAHADANCNSNENFGEESIKNEINDENDIYVLNNSRTMSQANKSNNSMTKYATSQQTSTQFTDNEFLSLLNEDHIQKYLQLDSYVNFKPPIYQNNNLFYIDDHLASSQYKNSKSRRNFAARLTRYVFTPRERLESNCNGRGKKQFDQFRLEVMRNTIFKYYPCKQATVVVNGDTISTGDCDENLVWFRDCMPAIDESNRVLKKQVLAWHKKCMMSSKSVTNNNNSVNSTTFGNPMHSMLGPSATSSSYLNQHCSSSNNNDCADYYQFDYEDEFDEF